MADDQDTNERLTVENLCIGYQQRRSHTPRVLARDIAFQVQLGQCLVILGPNGAGKTTLLRTLLGLQTPLAGSIRFSGRDAGDFSLRERARWLAYVPQARKFEFAFRVIDLVAMGAAPRLTSLAMPSEHDYQLAHASLEQLGIAHLTDAEEPKLSGGEQQLVLLARALTQRSRFLLLDEPTASLDLKNQQRVLDQVTALARTGLGVIMISHAPAHAFRCATHVALFGRDGQFSVGDVDSMLTEERLSAVYEIPVRILTQVTARGVLRTCLPEIPT